MLSIEAIRQIARATRPKRYPILRAVPWRILRLPSRCLHLVATYVFHEKKPQIDHIFPLRLAGADAKYEELVDVLWNCQPIPDGVNNYKRARHPKEFLNSSDGAKYWDSYDFIPERKSPIWDDPARFIQVREERMRGALLEQYGLELEHTIGLAV